MKKIYGLIIIICTVFSVTAQEPYLKLTVDQHGSGDFTSVQEAINSTRDLGPGRVIIFIKKGVYNEKIEIPSWKHQLTLIGEDTENTIIQNGDYSGMIHPVTKEKLNTFTSYTLLIQGDDIHLKNLTVKNTSCDQGQAVALHVEGDRFIAKNCNFLGCQDTLYTATEGSRQYYENCFIEGTTDFIFGEATALFQECTIKSLANSFITAAATPENQAFGYVFLDCKFIAKDGVDHVYLGRPWRPYAQTVFIKAHLGKHIVEKAWDPWAGDKMFPNKQKTTYYSEYQSTGPGAAPKKRVDWSHQLTEREVKKYTLKNILSGKDQWNPLAEE